MTSEQIFHFSFLIRMKLYEDEERWITFGPLFIQDLRFEEKRHPDEKFHFR